MGGVAIHRLDHVSLAPVTHLTILTNGKKQAMSDRVQDPDRTAANSGDEGSANVPVTPNRVAEALRLAGFRAKIGSNDHYCWVESASNGKDFHVNFYGADSLDPDLAYPSIRLFTTFADCTACDAWRLIPVCNEFNFSRRYGTAVIVSANGTQFPALQHDISCVDGLSDAALADAIEVYVRRHDEFIVVLSRASSDTLQHLVRRHQAADRLMWSDHEDQARAVEAYMSNAEAGYGGSQAVLGSLYRLGIEVPQSDLLAVHYLTLAAERGQPAAFMGLAQMFMAAGGSREFGIQAAKFAAIAAATYPEGQQKTEASGLCSTILERLDDESQYFVWRSATDWRPLILEGGPIVDLTEIDDIMRRSGRQIH